MARHDQRHAPDSTWRCQGCRHGLHEACVGDLLALAAATRDVELDLEASPCACHRAGHPA